MELRFDVELREELVSSATGVETMLDDIEHRLANLFEHYLEPDVLPLGPAKEALPLPQAIKVYMAHAQMGLGRRLGIISIDLTSVKLYTAQALGAHRYDCPASMKTQETAMPT